MKLLDRVFYSIKEKPVKSLLILLVVCLLGTFMSASFSIYQSTTNLEKKIKEDISPIVLIDWGMEVSNEEKKENIANQIKKDDRVSFVENRYGLNSYDYDLLINYKNGENVLNEEHCNLLGVDNTILSDYLDNEIFLLSGGMLEQNKNEKEIFYVQISDRTVMYENLDLGDELVFYLKPRSYTSTLNGETTTMYYPFPDLKYENIKVVGLGEFNQSRDGRKYHTDETKFADSNLHYVSKYTMEQLSKLLVDVYKDITQMYPDYFVGYKLEDLGKMYLNQTYIRLNNIDDLKGFISDVYKLDKGDIKDIYSFSDSINDVGNIVDRMSLISIITLIIACVSAVILLSLVIQIFVHERRHEIGIFISLGESKKNIIKQILLEVLIIGMMGISLSVFSGNIIGSRLSEGLLDKQMEQYTQVNTNLSEDAYQLKEEEIVNAFDTSITMEYVISVYAGGFIVLALSCIYPTRSILKMKARKMLL